MVTSAALYCAVEYFGSSGIYHYPHQTCEQMDAAYGVAAGCIFLWLGMPAGGRAGLGGLVGQKTAFAAPARAASFATVFASIPLCILFSAAYIRH